MMKKITLTFCTFALAFCWAAETQGHGMSLFASYDGKKIKGTAKYHADVPVDGAEVIVTAHDHDGEWWKTETDSKGNFSVDVPPHDEYKVVVDPGGGHAAETVVRAMPQGGSSVSDAQIVELRREIHELTHTIRLRDILGGIGYFFGLVGVFMYFKAKERRAENK